MTLIFGDLRAQDADQSKVSYMTLIFGDLRAQDADQSKVSYMTLISSVLLEDLPF